MGILLHQRDLLTLHASAVSIADGAVAFVGAKGAGKSTVTAALAHRGHGLLSDDVTALDVRGKAPPVVLRGLEAVKLWPDSLAVLGLDPSREPALHEETAKRVFRPIVSEDGSPRPLRCIYVLEEGDQIESALLPPHQAFRELARHTYAARFLGGAVTSPTHFEQCASVLQTVAVRKLVRSDDITRVDRLAEHVESEWS